MILQSKKMLQSLLSSNKTYLLLLSIFYLLFCSYFLPYFQYHINPDGISQISLALKYASGNFSEAFNPYWGFSMSTLTAVLVLFNTSPLFAIKIVLILSGLFLLLGIYSLSNYFISNTWIKKIYLISLVFVIPYFAFQVVTADLLFTVFLVWYLFFVFNPNYQVKILYGILTGLFGGLLFLTRENGFYFFLIHFSLINLYFYKVEKKVLKSFIFGLIFFLLISFGWIFILSYKYDRIIVGSKSAYIWSWIGPESAGLPAFTKGIIDLPNQSALSNWEDPTNQKIELWNPFYPLSHLIYQLNNSIINFFELIKILNLLSPLIIPFLGLALYLYLQKHKKLNRNITALSILTLIIYIPAYLVSYIGDEQRYFWIILILSYLLSGHLTEIFSQYLVKFFSYSKQKALFIICFLFFFVIYFFITPSFLNLVKISKYDNEKSLYNDSKKLSKILTKDSQRIASNEEHNQSLVLSFFTNNHYLGQTNRFLYTTTSHKSQRSPFILRSNISDLMEQFKKYQIDYYFVWNNDPISEELNKHFPIIPQSINPNLKIFYIENK